MNFFLIAGEPSGDQHAAALIRALRSLDPQAAFAFFGGDRMEEEAGVKAVVSIRNLAFMGFTQLITKIFRIGKNFRACREAIRSFRPDVVVAVDYGGFNLRMIRWAKANGYRVAYYIPPKAWAWMPGRSRKLARYADRVLVTLPFEEPFFSERGVNTVYVGNPVAEQLESWKGIDRGKLKRELGFADQKIIALLPGSRSQELAAMLPVMTEMAEYFPGYQFVVAAHDRFREDQVSKLLRSSRVRIIRGKTLELLAVADAALVTSGTATLEAALIRTPQVVCYRSAPVSYLIARLLIRVRYISLVNLILDEPCVPELIQGHLTASRLRQELGRLLEEGEYRTRMGGSYDRLAEMLGSQRASMVAAGWVLDTAQGR